MNELNQIYQSILLALGNKIDTQSKVSCLMNGTEYPLRIDGKDMYLPTTEALASGSDQKVYFHPACENIISKETEVFKLLRRIAGIRLMMVFRSMVPTLFEIAGKKEKKNWTQVVYDVTTPLAGVKKSVREEVFEFLGRMSIEVEDGVDNRFVHFKVTKGGKGEHGERVYYKASPQYPIYDLLVREFARSEGQAKNATVTVNKHSISREAVEVLIHLFRVMLPSVVNPTSAEFDANIPVAARFTAFMYCFGNLAEQINKSQNMFRADFDKKSIYIIDTSWTESLENLPEFYRQVPELDYNSHNVYKEGDQQNQALSGNMAGFLNISTNPNGAPQGQNVQSEGSRWINGIEYVMKVPQMQFGDKYQRSEPNINTNRVNHYAIDAMNQPVVYVCSRMGNFLHREAMNQHMYPNQPYQQYQQAPQYVDQYGRPIQQAPQQPYYPNQQPYQPATSTGQVAQETFTSAW